MVTILSFSATKGEQQIYSEVNYDLITKEVVYSSFKSTTKVEQRKSKSIIIPTAYFEADLKFALENGYKVKII